jgi:hypothetical protein
MLKGTFFGIDIVFIGGAVFCLALVVYAIWVSGKRKKDK